jgi:hypothetical protein
MNRLLQGPGLGGGGGRETKQKQKPCSLTLLATRISRADVRLVCFRVVVLALVEFCLTYTLCL